MFQTDAQKLTREQRIKNREEVVKQIEKEKEERAQVERDKKATKLHGEAQRNVSESDQTEKQARNKEIGSQSEDRRSPKQVLFKSTSTGAIDEVCDANAKIQPISFKFDEIKDDFIRINEAARTKEITKLTPILKTGQQSKYTQEGESIQT